MTRVNVLLWLALIGSALFLVHTQYESRRLFVELDKAQALARSLEVEHDRLEVEKRGQATPLRVEKLARDSLHMQSVTPGVTDYVALTTPAPTSASAAQGGRP